MGSSGFTAARAGDWKSRFLHFIPISTAKSLCDLIPVNLSRPHFLGITEFHLLFPKSMAKINTCKTFFNPCMKGNKSAQY